MEKKAPEHAGDRSGGSPMRGLSRRAALAFGTSLTLALPAQARIQELGEAIDKAGAQRMLSQRMGKAWLAQLRPELSERARQVRMTTFRSEQIEIDRRSSRTGQVHSIGGLTGSAAYEGELQEFLPLLRAAEWTGVGRQTVWGKGQIVVRPK